MTSTTGKSARAALAASVALLSIAGCTKKAEPAPVAAAPAPLALSVPLVDVMRASVEIPADGIWGVTTNEKLTDEEWLLADQDAIGLIAASTLMTTPTTGPKDKAWQANADYQAWALDIQKTAIALREAAKAKDLPKLAMNGDHMLETCQACHDKYRPATPSDGSPSRYPFYPARKLVKE
ncbi:MAG TPA: cytochrome c [Caulobacteraceae bacterium]|jgi:hypothetical protein|nr:cytochrome c [Caulobacteraceae bacterium]